MTPTGDILAGMDWPEILEDLRSGFRGWAHWLLLGLLIAVLLFVGWFRDWWLTNVLRNRLEAKRRLKRESREPGVKP